jgi:UDP:flavonoid glycosyltransferase YjiC (YdhE family)
LGEVVDVLANVPTETFHLFAPKHELDELTGLTDRRLPAHIVLKPSGDPSFDEVLVSAKAVVSTAGHTLLSEAMHLGIPVLATPLALYEQQMNAQVIADAGFGASAPRLSVDELTDFLARAPEYRNNITRDDAVLKRDNGLNQIVDMLTATIEGAHS